MKRSPALFLAATLLLRAGALVAQPPGPSVAQAGKADLIGVDQMALLGRPEGTPLAGEALDRAVEEATSKMRCPVCQGLSVADSQTLSALAMKGETRDFLAAGYTEEQVITYFERSYGEFIRLEPKPQGFNLLVWIAPVIVLLAGLALIGWRLRASRPAVEPADAEVDDPLAAYRERIRREVSS